MANIPVEPVDSKAGVPWWTWLLGLLALLLLVFLFSQCGDDQDDVVVVDDTTAVAPIATTDLDLSDVYVTRVVGDNTFFVASTPGGTDETLVYLEEEATPGTATEGRYDVTPGQHLSLTGQYQPVGNTDLTAWGLTPAQVGEVGERYIQASSLTKLGADGAADGAEATGAVDGDAAASPTTSGTGEIATLQGIGAVMAENGAAGRAVRLNAVEVTALEGDSTFYVGSGADRVLVVLRSLGESQSGSGNGSDGAFDVNVGDRVTINGTLRAYERGMAVMVTDRAGFTKQ